jgi:hypothetical protein
MDHPTTERMGEFVRQKRDEADPQPRRHRARRPRDE